MTSFTKDRDFLLRGSTNVEDGIPDAMYDEAIKLLQDAKANGHCGFLLGIADPDGKDFTFGKAMTNNDLTHAIVGILEEFADHTENPALKSLTEVVHAVMHGIPIEAAEGTKH